MSGEFSISNVQAALLERVDRKFERIREPEQIIQQMFPFQQGKRIGDKYVKPVQMTDDQGFTFRAAGSASTATALNDAVPAQWEEAQFNGSIMDWRSRIDIEVLARTQDGSEQAVIQGAAERIEAMQKGMVRHNEWSLLQGGRPLAKIEQVSGASTTRAWVLYAGSYAAAFLLKAKNMPLDVFTDEALTAANKVNTNAKVVVVSFVRSTRTLNVSGNATDLTNITADHFVARRGENATTMVPGIIRRLQLASGIVDNINTATYPEWIANIVDFASTNVNMAKLLQGDALLAEGGLSKAEKIVLLDARNFAVLNADLSARRSFDGSYRRTKAENGFAAIEFVSPTGGLMVTTHPYMKGAEVAELTRESWERLGSQDLTLNIPGDGSSMATLVADYQAYEYRGFSLQGMFCSAPLRNTLFTGITQPSI